MLLVAGGSFVVFIVVVYLVAAPAMRRDLAEDPAEVATLVARKDQLLSDIRELDMDLVTGKLEEDDHRRLRAATLVAAVDTLKAIEDAAPVPEPADEPDEVEPSETIDARLEARITARKHELEESACPTCTAVADPADAFCRRCGAELSKRRAG